MRSKLSIPSPIVPIPVVLVTLLACAGSGGSVDRPSPPVNDNPTEATLTVSPTSGPPGSEVRLEARGLPPNQRVGVGAGPPASEYEIFEHASTNAEGILSLSVTVPDWVEPGRSVIFAVDVPGPRDSVLSEPFRVEAAGDEPREGAITITGTLTDEGVECPAVRGDDGRLYTLAGGDVDDFSPGDRLRIRGTVARMSFCMQRTTISVDTIEEIGS